MDATRLWRLDCPVKSYAWGSHTAIPALRGEPPAAEPQAELWIGAHPAAPARVCANGEGGIALDAWIRSEPRALLGEPTAARFGGELPFLLKLLAAAQSLSIQAHPSQTRARAGFARENAAGLALDDPRRCYRDPRHKPELICALTPFRALDRFREPAGIERGIASLGVPGLGPLLEPLRRSPDRRGLETFFRAWMTLDPGIRAPLVEAAGRAAAERPDTPERDWVARLAGAHPGDPGVLAPLLLNLVELAPGEALFLPAGELHSYLEGTGVELMASSDNVLRGGLTQKHVDVPELLAALSFEAGPVERLIPRPIDPVESRYATPAEEFALSRLQLEPPGRWESPAARGPELVLCVAGEARAAAASGPALELRPGDSLFAPAAAGAYRIEGRARLFRASVALSLLA